MSLARRLVSTGSANFVAFILSIANSVLLTRLLGPDGRGEFAIFATSSALLTLLLLLGLDFALGYFLARSTVRPETVGASVLAFAACSGGLSLVLVLLSDRLWGAEVFLPRSKQVLYFEVMLAVLVTSSMIFAGGRAVFLGTRSFQTLNVLDVALALASLGAYALLFLFVRSGLVLKPGTILTVFTLLASLSAVVLWGVALSRGTIRWTWTLFEAAVAWEMLSVGLKAYTANLLQFLNYRLDYWIVGYFTSLHTLGLYSLASTVSQTFWLLPKAAASVLFPVFASGDRTDMEGQALIARLALWVSIVTGSVAVWAGPWLIPLFYGKDFGQAAVAFRVLMIGSVPYVLSIILASGLAARGLQSENTRASFWGFASTLGLDLLLIPSFGIVGAASASSASYLVTTAYVVHRFTRAFGVPYSRIIFLQPGDARLLFATLRNIVKR